ncbi:MULTISPECIES: energy transducer TonB [Shewanella]|jgi:protein TonB|uniref:Protein TonB n=2 Tax=Shewanella TaxID=22 RepID=A0AAJ1BF88_9GAMM|nr:MULTISPECIES: energy transducer TonB [Shewanella]AZQ09961.1 transport protein TonB [Shewanella khirikhana]MCH4293681.1 energy transducer TonB [Shewanella zhuhaiensis]
MLRALVSIIIGALVTFGLFWFMAALVGGGATRHDNSTESPVIEITMDRQDAKAQNKPRVVPKPPPPPEQPPKPDTTPPDTSTNIDGGLTFNMGGLEAGGASTGFKLGNMMTRDGDATPIVRIEPQYPIAAARDGKEGWVQLRFTINEIGGVDDVEVIAAEPKRVFDKEAIRALKKWKYKPKVVDGQAQKQTGMTVQLDFKLDKGGK